MTSKTFNFTINAITALPNASTGKRDQYQDIKEKALRLEVTDKGKKTFKVYRKMQGRPIRYTIGDFGDWTIENARKSAGKISADIALGVNPNSEKQKIRQEMTFGTMFQEYMERYSKKHKRSWKYDEREINRFVSHWFNRKLSAITFNDVQRLHHQIGMNSGQTQANNLVRRVHAIYNKAIEWGWDGSNPAKGIKKFKEKSRERFLTPKELPFFFAALREEENETACDYILMSLYTGARKSNVLSMRWAEIDLEQSLWRIPETKNGEPLTIALSEEAVDVLLRRKKHSNSVWVFPSDKTHGHVADPTKAWKRILTNATIKFWYSHTHIRPLVEQAQQKKSTFPHCRKLYSTIADIAQKKNVDLPTGLMDIRIHDLRRTLGSFQAAAGANQYIIGKSLGHKSQQATAIYARLDLDPVRASVQAASTAIRNAGKGGDKE
ncbi:MAG: tyrosine-type recombinase/integrase [Ignavibacteriae bacterium]|nr:tyrosine-type recombinase/integrase [Ignavibacteriota bacterium]MCB9217201.1 tyrosine-type recombinase/integrase [Ignavibacteria bacterium]